MKKSKTRKRKTSFDNRRESAGRAAKGITKLVKWCESRGFEVSFRENSRDEIYYDLKRITICTKASIESQLIGLLHECGHLLLHDNMKEYTRRWGRGWPKVRTKDKTLKKRPVHRMQLLEEEIEAWNRAYTLGQKLKMKIDLALWNQIRFSCLAWYAGWTARRWEMAA